MDLDQQPTPGPDYVRPAQDEDLDQLVELAAAFYRQDRFATAREHLRANMRVMLGGAGYVSVAVRGDRVVGFAVTKSTYGLEHGYIAQLQDVYVSPHWRGVGFGDALISDALAWAYSKGATRLELVIAPTRGDMNYLTAYFDRLGFIDESRQLRHLSLKLRPLTGPPRRGR